MSLSLDNKTIYEIFRGCRLCGAGGGYKMPIIPSVVGFDCADIDLRQKIRECVQIEVNQDDKMPPLICELCVDKVNDFYEFLAMCRDTNVKTRKRLGLPDLQTQNSSEADNCILGVTEPVYQQDEDDEPLQRTPRPGKVKVAVKREDKRVRSLKKEVESLIKQETTVRDSRDSRSSRDRSDGPRAGRGKPSPSPTPPPRDTRHAGDPASRLKVIEIEDDDESLPLVPLGKRTRDRGKDETPNKKLKLLIKVPPPETPPPPSRTKPRPGPKCSKRDESPLRPKQPPSPAPKSVKTPPSPKPFKRPPSPHPGPKSKTSQSQTKSAKIPTPLLISKSKLPGPKSSKSLSPAPSVKKSPVGKSIVKGKPGASPVGDHTCGVCASVFQSIQGFGSHMRAAHCVRFTNNDLACNPCGEWFSSSEEAAAHHKQHRSRNKPYTCRGCGEHCRSLQAYTQHASVCACVPWTELPDVSCAQCCRLFPTRALLALHRCKGGAGGGKCSKCNKTYSTSKSLKRHEKSCSSKKKASNPHLASVPASLRRRLLPASVRVARCDERLAKNERGRYHVGGLPEDFGLDPNCVYPYRALVRVKQEPLSFDGMVSINKDVRDEFYIEEDYVHWDSDNSSSDEEFSLINPTEKIKRVPSLTTLTLKTIYSKRCLGKVPRKLRKVRTDKFDSFFNPETEFDNVQNDINNIIDNLGDDNDGSETLCGFSLCDIKLTDVKSISEVENIGAADDEVNGDTNYESDSLLENDSEIIANHDKSNTISDQTSFNIVNKHLINAAVDTGSETDASIEDNAETQGTKQNFDEKDTASENSLNIEPQGTKQNDDEKDTASENSLNIGNNHLDNTENVQNGNTLRTEASIENNYDVTENQTDLINEIDELYDKKLMDELDAQIDDKNTNPLDKSEKILLKDLVPEKDGGLGLDNISDEEFNFDA